MGNFFTQAGSLIVQTVFGIAILTVMLRFLLQLVRADFYNPFSQFLVKFSNPLLLPLRRIIPGLGGIDLASVVLLLLLKGLELFLLLALAGGAPQLGLIVVIAIADLIELVLWIFIVAIFVRVLASWFNPHGGHPLMDLLISLTEPLMRPARRLIPPLGGMDLSPIAVLLLLQIGLLLLHNLMPTLLTGVR